MHSPEEFSCHSVNGDFRIIITLASELNPIIHIMDDRDEAEGIIRPVVGYLNAVARFDTFIGYYGVNGLIRPFYDDDGECIVQNIASRRIRRVSFEDARALGVLSQFPCHPTERRTPRLLPLLPPRVVLPPRPSRGFLPRSPLMWYLSLSPPHSPRGQGDKKR